MSDDSRSREESRTEEPGDRSTGRKLKQQLKLAAGLLAAVVTLLLVVQNQEPMQTRFLTWTLEMPRFALLAFIYLLGAATGWIVRRGRG